MTEKGQALLAFLESARDLLARRLVREFHTVPDPDLNFLTVSSLFQILFLRTGEECGFVEPGTIAALAGCDGIAKRMARACSDAGLDPDLFFEKGPEGTRTLPALPDKTLREIITMMDRPDFPAPVSPLSLEEFVAVLEYFLGTRMQADEGSRVKRAPKSAMLYTGSVDVPLPEVVDYIANGIVDRLKCRSAPGDEPAGRVLDPACGAGIFLLAVYRQFVRKMTEAGDHFVQVRQSVRDLAGRSVFGTDIDPESVSAARIVLLLAFIEESRRTGGSISPDLIRGVCTSLVKTIRCGNALIAPDYFAGKPVFPFNAGERRKVNAFDWKEAFPEIVREGGFDAVIGAPPPYRPLAVPAREEYFQTHYDTYAPSAGLYGYFIERGLSLLKPGGRMIVLVPGTLLRSHAARPLRRFLLSRQIDTIANTGKSRLFADGNAGMYLLSLRNQPPFQHGIFVQEWDSEGLPPGHAGTGKTFTLDQRSLDDGGWILEDTRTADIHAKIQAAGTPLDHYVMGEIAAGKVPVRNNPRVINLTAKNRLTKKAWWCRRFIVPLLRPADIRRYRPVKPERFVVQVRDGHNIRKCRTLVKYVEQKMKEREERSGETGSREQPVTVSGLLGDRQEPEENRPKIIFSEFQYSPAFFFDLEGAFAITSSLKAIRRNDPFLAGILNSALARFVLTRTCPLTERGYHLNPASVGKFPVYVPDFEKLADKVRHDKIVSLVTHILELNRYLPQVKTDQERRLVQQEIDATEVRIDALVYELYGLTPEEIAIVEESTGMNPSCLQVGKSGIRKQAPG